MINRKLILSNAPSGMNEQVNINHVGCPSGEDRKKRLYIKRTTKGLVAYCHHCADSGFAQDGTEGRLSTWFKTKPTDVLKITSKPVIGPLEIQGRVWLCDHYCDPNNKDFSGVQGKDPRVALSLHNPVQEVIGWQVRNLLPDATPKYTTYYNQESNRGDSSWFHKNSTALVITEDYLSAHRVFNDTTLSSVALLRTTISDRTLRQIYDLDFKFIFIWLDPDAAGIEGTTKAYKKLSHYLPKETVIGVYNMDKEPKECTPNELRKLLI